MFIILKNRWINKLVFKEKIEFEKNFQHFLSELVVFIARSWFNSFKYKTSKNITTLAQKM